MAEDLEMEVGGVKSATRMTISNGGRNFTMEVKASAPIPPVLLEMILYEVAHKLAVKHAIVNTMLEMKGDRWD